MGYEYMGGIESYDVRVFLDRGSECYGILVIRG